MRSGVAPMAAATAPAPSLPRAARDARIARVSALVFAGHVLVAAFVALHVILHAGRAGAPLLRSRAPRAPRDPASHYLTLLLPEYPRRRERALLLLGDLGRRLLPLERSSPSPSSRRWCSCRSRRWPSPKPSPRRCRPGGRSLGASAWALACPLAYSYFLYRGLFNYALGIPFAFFALSAVVALGVEMRATTRVALTLGALAATALAAFAHASAIAFLFFAIPVACAATRAPRAGFQRAVGVALMALLFASMHTSTLGGSGAPAPEWWPPWTMVLALVRTFGVTQSWFEIVPALTLLTVLGATVVRLAPSLLALRTRYSELWPFALALVVFAGYFVVPNAMNGISGLSQRLPLFAAMLLLPFVPASGRVARALAYAAAPFGIYVALINASHERHVRAMLEAADAVPMERDASIYLVALDVTLEPRPTTPAATSPPTSRAGTTPSPATSSWAIPSFRCSPRRRRR